MDFCIGKRLKDSKIESYRFEFLSDGEKEFDVVDSKIVKAIVNATYVREVNTVKR